MSKWFVSPNRLQFPKLRLICLPYAGGSAGAFHEWCSLLPENVEVRIVQLPGRAERFNEPHYTSIRELVEVLAGHAMPLTKVPYVVFGHSLGALIGYELVKRLRGAGAVLPSHFVASGCRPPHLRTKQTTYDLPRASFIQELKEMNGTPAAILDNDELIELCLPILRSDFQMAETYRADLSGPPLDCQVSVFHGAQDDGVPAEKLDGWFSHFSGRGEMRVFDGDHFFIEKERPRVLRAVADILESVRCSAPIHA